MSRQTWTWTSAHLPEPARVVRWGHFGTPVLLFPTAGGDYEEVERFQLIHVLGPLLDTGRIKVYSVDSLPGKYWLKGTESPEYCSRLQNRFDTYLYEEVVPLIRRDCQTQDIEVIAAGASIGAFHAVATVCRHPDAFRLAIGMSGTYDMSPRLHGRMNLDFYFSSPLHYLPELADGPQLQALRKRFILMPSGQGRWEDIGQSWRMAQLLGVKGVPNRVDPWGPEWDHDWISWRAWMPKYLGELA